MRSPVEYNTNNKMQLWITSVLLAICLSCQWVSSASLQPYEPSALPGVYSANEYSQFQQQANDLSEQQLRGESAVQRTKAGNSYSQKKYLPKDFSAELSELIAKQSYDQWKLKGLNQILDALGSSIATLAPPPPSFARFGGRADGLSSASGEPEIRPTGERSGEPQLFALERETKSQSPRKSAGPQQQPLVGIVWPQSPSAGSSSSSNSRGSPRKHPFNSTASRGATVSGRPYRLSGSEEFALQAPVVGSRTSNDYQWKRVENSNWNKLRGMWGKRTVGGRVGDGGINAGARLASDRDQLNVDSETRATGSAAEDSSTLASLAA